MLPITSRRLSLWFLATAVTLVMGCAEPTRWLEVDAIDGPEAADVLQVVAGGEESPAALARTADHLWVYDGEWRATRTFDGGTFASVKPPGNRDSLVWALERWWWLEQLPDGDLKLRRSANGREWDEFDLPGTARQPALAPTGAVPQASLSLTVEGTTLYLVGPRRIWRLDASGEPIWHRIDLEGIGSLHDPGSFPGFIRTYLPRSAEREFELLTVFSRQLRVYRRNEHDAPWMMVSTIPSADKELVSAPDGEVLFAVTVDGVFRSNDDAETWFRFWPADAAALSSFAMVADSSGGVGFALLAGTTDGSILRSVDQGGSWETVRPGGATSREVSSLVVAADRMTVFAGTRGTGIWVSSDGGKSWAPENKGLGGARPLAVDYREDGGIALADPGGVWLLTGGLTARWNALNTRYPASVLGAADGRVVTGTVDGSIAIQSSREDMVEIESLFREGVGPEVLPTKRAELLDDRAVVLLRQRPGTEVLHAWSKGRGAAISRDSGSAWERLTLDPSILAALGDEPIRDVQLDSKQGIYLTQSRAQGGIRIWASTDDGATWKAIREVESDHAAVLVLGAREGDALLVISDGTVQRSLDGGARWETVEGPWAGLNVLHAAYDAGKLLLLVDSRPGYTLMVVENPVTTTPAVRRYALRWPQGPPISPPLSFDQHEGEVLMMGREDLWRVRRPGTESPLPFAATVFATALGILVACALVFFTLRRM